MRLGIITGGGDCPGLNAVIRAAVRKGVGVHGHTFMGFRDGWKGVVEDDSLGLGIPQITGILHRGGTILGSSGMNPFRVDGGVEAVEATFERRGLDGLIAIGGEGTLGAAAGHASRRRRTQRARRSAWLPNAATIVSSCRGCAATIVPRLQ